MFSAIEGTLQEVFFPAPEEEISAFPIPLENTREWSMEDMVVLLLWDKEHLNERKCCKAIQADYSHLQVKKGSHHFTNKIINKKILYEMVFQLKKNQQNWEVQEAQTWMEILDPKTWRPKVSGWCGLPIKV